MAEDYDSDDPFALPGVIKERKEVTIDEMSSDDDDDDDTCLLSGQAKKEALREKERRKNLRTQTEGTKPSDAHETNDDVTEVAPPGSGIAGKRARSGSSGNGECGSARRRGGGGAGPSSETYDDEPSPALDARDRQLLAEDAAIRERQASQLRKFKHAFELDDDDDEPAPSRTGQSGRQAARTKSGERGLGSTVGGLGSTMWLTVHTYGLSKTMQCQKGSSLKSSDFLKRVADALSLDAERTQLRRAVRGDPTEEDLYQPGEALDSTRTPIELGLVPLKAGDPPRHVWAEEAAEEVLRICIRRNGQSTHMSMAPTATFESLLSRYCAQHGGGGLTPAQCSLEFDGDVLRPKDTPAKHELEEGDLLDLRVR
jgi:hypothetical protein